MTLPPEKQAFVSDWVEYKTEKPVITDFHDTIKTQDFELFWDIGAYRGLYTLIAAEYIPYTYAFEPAPIPRENLQQNCHNFEITNYEAISIPLYDKTEYQDLTVDTTSGSRTFIKGTSPLPERETSKTVTRRVQRSDTVIKNTHITRPDIIKIDIEGAEYEVLSGFGEYLPEIETIFVEIHLSKQRTDTVTPLLEDNGFSITTLRTRTHSEDDYQKFIKAINSKNN